MRSFCGTAIAVALLLCGITGQAAAEDRPAAFTSEPVSFCDLDRSHLESPEWQTAIATAKSHMSRFGGYYSLLRVVLQEPKSDHERLRVDATKLKELTPEYSGGGGRFRDVASGGFVLMQHLPNGASSVNGTAPIIFRSLYRGMATIQIPIPARDVLQVVGDVVVHSRAPSEQQDPVVLDDVRRAPHEGLLGRAFKQVTMLTGRWEQTQPDVSKPSPLYFVVTHVGDQPLKSPARFDSVEIVDTAFRPVAPAVGQTWNLAGYEELVITNKDASADASPPSRCQHIRVVLKGVQANLDR